MSFYVVLENRFAATQLLFQWLEMIDLGKLDSAVCNKNERKSLLNLISNSCALMNGLFGKEFLNSNFDGKYFQWLLRRKVSVKYMCLKSSTLDIVKVNRNKEKVCSNVTSLKLSLFHVDWVALRLVLSLFPRL